MSSQTPEGKFKKDVIAWLKKRRCVVRINKQDATTPAGFPDLTFFKEGMYGMLELKASEKSEHQPGQDRWIDKFNDWSYARFVYPENWDEVSAELEEMLKD